jgi:hypothetical protein
MQMGEVPLPSWINSYVNDFLCMPILLYLCRYVVRFLRSDSELLLPYPPIFLLTLFYAVYFEAYLPDIDPRYTADIHDVFLYFAGSGFFIGMQYARAQRIP